MNAVESNKDALTVLGLIRMLPVHVSYSTSRTRYIVYAVCVVCTVDACCCRPDGPLHLSVCSSPQQHQTLLPTNNSSDRALKSELLFFFFGNEADLFRAVFTLHCSDISRRSKAVIRFSFLCYRKLR